MVCKCRCERRPENTSKGGGGGSEQDWQRRGSLSSSAQGRSGSLKRKAFWDQADAQVCCCCCCACLSAASFLQVSMHRPSVCAR